MLTRSGVAKRLGKSLATVRRMEGYALHPTRDERGVHRFDPDEVEAVARGETDGARGSTGETWDSSAEIGHDGFAESLARMVDDLREAQEEFRRMMERAMPEQQRAIRDEVQRSVREQLEEAENERVLGEILSVIEEGHDELDDDELVELWDIVDELVE